MLCVQVLIPSFRTEHDFLYSLIYAWMGDSAAEIIQTIVFRPEYVAAHVFTPEKLAYLLDLLGPLLFLPLLRPDIMLIALPSLAINLVSMDRIHWSIRYHYQAFIVPFLLIATIYAITEKRFARYRPACAALLIAAALGSQLVLRSPLIHLATRPRDVERITTAHAFMARLPADAPLSVTSTLAPHLARRQELYFFPGNVIYPPELADQGRYLLADLREVPPENMPRLQQLRQSSTWQLVAEQDDFVLLERVAP